MTDFSEEPPRAGAQTTHPTSTSVPGPVHETLIYSSTKIGAMPEPIATIPYAVSEAPIGDLKPIRIVTIGAGASGINMAFQLKNHMTNVEHIVYEKNEAVGGTWFENRYPGCKCDIPSHNYQFSWSPNPSWRSFFSSHSEIRDYLEDCCAKFDLHKDIRLKHSVKAATWDGKSGTWKVTIWDEERQVSFDDICHFLIDGSGILNDWKWPEIPGLHSFNGDLVHSANWPQEFDYKGKSVAVLGTGSSGVQIVPALQPDVKKLVHFIRSPTWVVPPRFDILAQATGVGLTEGAFTEEQRRIFRNDPAAYLKFVKVVETSVNARFPLLLNGSQEQKMATAGARAYMQHTLQSNPELQQKLIPDFPIGCRRITPAVGYLESLSASNVKIVTQGIREVVPEGLRLNDGSVVEVDALVCATGFNVSFVPRFPLVGTQGNLQDIWRKELPRSYLSMAVPSCPNYFTMLGPNAPIGHGSALTIIEHASKYIIKMVKKAQEQSIKSFAPSQAAVDDFAEHIDSFMPRTAWSGSCSSWFKNGKVDGPVTALHPGSRIHWFHMLETPRYEDYIWTYSTRNRFQYLGNGFSTKEAEGQNDTWYLDEPLDLYA